MVHGNHSRRFNTMLFVSYLYSACRRLSNPKTRELHLLLPSGIFILIHPEHRNALAFAARSPFTVDTIAERASLRDYSIH